MKLLDLLRTANRNLLRSKLRTFLTVSAIFVGAFTLTLTTALGAGAQQYLNRQLGNVSAPGIFYVTAKNDNMFGVSSEVKEYDSQKQQASSAGFSTLTQADVDKLQKVEGVKSAKPFYSVAGTYMTRDGIKKYAPPAMTQYDGLSLDLAAGRLISPTDQNRIILPENYLQPLGFSSASDAVGKEVVLAYQDVLGIPAEQKVSIAGVMKKSFITQGQMYLDDALVKKIATAQGQTNRFFAVFAQFSDTSVGSETTQKQAIESAGSYTATSLKEQVGTINTIISAITTGLNVVGIIALFAASFGIINTLLMSVYERTSEVGLMKALGMHRSKVFRLFAIEAVLVGFWGSAIAVAVGYAVSRLVNQWATGSFLKDFEGFTLLVVTPWNALMVMGLIMLVAFLAGTLPALKASRLNPIEALRNE